MFNSLSFVLVWVSQIHFLSNEIKKWIASAKEMHLTLVFGRSKCILHLMKVESMGSKKYEWGEILTPKITDIPKSENFYSKVWKIPHFYNSSQNDDRPD